PGRVVARHLLRKVRGKSQAHLIEADDDSFYVVKFVNNPQHRRTLVNEFVAGRILSHLNLSTPEFRIVSITSDFLNQTPDLCVTVDGTRHPIPPGGHFGSRYPGTPDHTRVYDFLPDSLFSRVMNTEEFRGALVVDRWLANSDHRQAIFVDSKVCATQTD